MDRAWIQHQIRRLDWLSLAAAGILLILGILFIYSAYYRGDGVPIDPFYQRQIIWALIGLPVMVGVSLYDYRKWGKICWIIYTVSIVLLILVLITGVEVSGGKRWLSFFGMRMQPSELAKIATLAFLAWFLSRPTRDITHPKVIVQAGAIAGLPFFLIFAEPDLGTAATLVPLTLTLLFVCGVPVKSFAFLMMLGIFLLPIGWMGLDEYQQDRILVFFDPGRDPLGAGWTRVQSEIAVGSGGLTGKGFLAGTQNILEYLPRNIAHTDFIYSVVAEETGFVGSALVLSLYAALLIGIVRTALLAADQFGRFLAIGVAALLFSHILINVAMTIGLMPITGLPLPLLSYGGSFTITTLCALGVVQSVYLRRVR